MFLTGLIVEAAANPDFWIVRSPLVACHPVHGRLAVPAGFVTDLASIPRALRNLPAFDPNGKSRRAAVLHDFLYAKQFLPKDVADTILRDALLWEGCSSGEAAAFYEAVSLFGASSWADDARRGFAGSFESLAAYKTYLLSIPSI